ncbi:MAG: hypothetical protein CR986_08725 [Ignavibacteriae bacterium]|nr:MAG: hypothetical protein CR986_08725 [Ignavibacteriota bacterium]
MLKKILFYILLFISYCYPQTKLINYKQTKNIISFNVKFESIKEIQIFNDIIGNNFLLPTKEIFVGIPTSSKVTLNYTVIKSKEIDLQTTLKFQPLLGDNERKKIFNKTIESLLNGKEYVKVLGYLWIDGIYCVHLRIDNLYYNNKEKIINQIQEVEIKLEFISSNYSKELKNVGLKNITTNNIVLNYDYIKKSEKENNIIFSHNEWISYDKEYVKINVAEDGIYRLSYNDLEEVGISFLNINPKSLKLFSKGKEIPIFVSNEESLSFGKNDYIEFVGLRNKGGRHRELGSYNKPYNEFLGRYTDTTTYWLTWDGAYGKRVLVESSTVNTLDTIKSYQEVIHLEKNNWFDFSGDSQVRKELPFWIENKTWGWGAISGGKTFSSNFNISNLIDNDSCRIFAKLHSYASQLLNKAHQLQLSLNNSIISSDTIDIDKYEKKILYSTVNSAQLIEGKNIVKVHSYINSSPINLCFFDWFEIEYPRYIIPINNELVFQFNVDDIVKNIRIKSPASDNFSVWRVGSNYRKFNALIANNSLTFLDTISSQDKYIYSDISQIKTPEISYKRKITNLINPQNQADYIIITHKKFIEKVNEYADFISETYNLKTKVINIENIYNQFSYGFFNPEAIKDFLMATHTYWQNPKPKYVFLIGGATYDYHGNKYKNLASVDYRVKNYVPSFGAPVSDNWFVTWDTTGAYIPQMNIGRIPVTKNEQIDRYLAKHRSFVNQKYDDWNKRYFFFSSGNSSSESELNSLRASNQFVIDNYIKPKPIGGNYFHFYKTANPQTNFGPISKDEFQSAIDQGAMLISYIGHSGTQIWDNSITEPEQLKNLKGRYPIVSDFGCSTGKFAEPDVTSFSELFTIGKGGQALAYFGNTSLGFVSTSVLSPKIFYKKIFEEKIYNISEAHKQAKLEILKNYGSSNIYKLFALTNTLIGDPILSVHIPTKPNFVLKQNDFKLFPEIPTDLDENANFKIQYFNYGSVPSDSLSINVIHKYKNYSDTTSLKQIIPKYNATINLNILTKNKVGLHYVTVILDPTNKFEEIYEGDNRIDFSFNVLSSSVRPILADVTNSVVSDSILFLNPTNKPINEKIIFEYSNENNFLNSNIRDIFFDTTYSKLETKNLLYNNRIFARVKIEGTDNYSPIFSFIKGNNKFLISDSISMQNCSISNIGFDKEDGIGIDSSHINFYLFSAGFEDGKAAVIERNAINFIPTNKVGHHITVFNIVPPYNFLEYKYFNTYAGGENITNYIYFLDTLSDNRLVLIAVSDEGRISSAILKSKIKELGSRYIDSVKFRSSWFFIGQTGDDKQFYAEKFSHAGDGPVSLDTVFSYLNQSGALTSNKIGPATYWKKITISDSLPNNSQITFRPILLNRQEEIIDTLVPMVFTNASAEINNIDAKKYPYIKLLSEFTASGDNQSPVLKSIAADYVGVPELAINYQVVEIEKDTVKQGEDITLSFYAYNVGESAADSFKVTVDVISPDNNKENIFTQMVPSLGSEQRKRFTIPYNTTSFNGERTFAITIDSDDKVNELFEDNNYFNIPFTVLGDTTKPKINITVDGNNIFDGDFVSSTPKIKIELNDESLLSFADTSFISLYLNNQRINYADNDNIIKVDYSQSNPKISLTYQPVLEDGDYSLTVFGQDAAGNLSDSSGVTKYFKVQSEHKLLNVYNYPNPFNKDTYITFKLTQIPEEVKIKVFTISGRLIKEINLNPSQLNYDLNKIYWDSRDEDGDLVGNGIYLYKVIMTANGKKQDVTQKMAVVR